jgi:hypothetical protein
LLQRPSGLQQLDESHHQTQQQQDLQTTVEQQHSGYSMPLLKQQQPQDLHLQQEHSLEQQLQLHQEQQQKASLEHSIAGQAQEEMSRLDLGAPLRNISAGLESADHPHVVWAAAEGTQPSQHSTVSHVCRRVSLVQRYATNVYMLMGLRRERVCTCSWLTFV